MPRLLVEEVCRLLRPYLDADPPRALCEKVQRYVCLLEVWNRKLNLTSVRDADEMVRRHFGESFFMARVLPEFHTLLDIGSGAGFPGLPISLIHPGTDVMLAEAHVKKAVFLREAAWMTGSKARVWAYRVEDMEQDYRFDVVTLRAVEHMQSALKDALARLEPGGTLAFFANEAGSIQLPEAQWADVDTYAIPQSRGQIVTARLAKPDVVTPVPMNTPAAVHMSA